jgi:hypothetical protein
MSRAIRWLGSDERTSQRSSLRLPSSGLPIGQPNCTRNEVETDSVPVALVEAAQPIEDWHPARFREVNRTGISAVVFISSHQSSMYHK